MKSYEAIQQTINGKVQEHAKRLGLGNSTLYKWQEPHTDYGDSGAYNPLDRVETLMETAEILRQPKRSAHAPLYYLAERFGYILLPLPQVSEKPTEIQAELLKEIKEFSDVTNAFSEFMADDSLSVDEADKLIAEAHELIRQTARFIEAIKKTKEA